MLRHLFITALRDLARSPVQSVIAIGGLAIGLMAAILAGIVTVDAYSRDHFIAGYERIYFAVMEEHSANGDHYQTATPYNLAGLLRDLPGVNAVARESGSPAVFSHGSIQAREKFAWADPEFFHIYRASALYGDLDAALKRPDGLIVTVGMARKYFGYDNVVGQALEMDHSHTMMIMAVIADWPLNGGNFQSTIFASSLSPLSRMSMDAGTSGISDDGSMISDGITLVRLAPGVSIDALNRQASAMVGNFVPRSRPYRRGMHFERVDELNMSQRLHPGAHAQLLVMEAVAFIILGLSCINFVSLSVARSAQRGLEVGVRKAAGAGRPVLIGQFLGESVLQVLFALCFGIVGVEWSLPAVNAFLLSGAVFDYWRDPLLLTSVLAGALTVGLLAGAYPSFVLSAFSPTIVLKGWARANTSGNILRQVMVILQFSALIAFFISAGVMFRQNHYVTTDAMGVKIDEMLIIRMPKCSAALKARIAALPGVRGAACSSLFVLPGGSASEGAFPRGGGKTVDVALMPVGPGFLELYGLKPIAGRFFRSSEDISILETPTGNPGVRYVINQAATRRLGYTSAAMAVGQPLHFQAAGLAAAMPGALPSVSRFNGTIVGVVKDFSFTPELAAATAGTKGIPPTVYSISLPIVGGPPSVLHVGLNGRDIPETLAAIDGEWKKSGALDPIEREFLDAIVQNQEATILKEGEAFAVFAGIAMLLACLGLFGLCMTTAQRRTKEIGIRKAMGASTADILALLFWQFTKPVLWANVIAWPLAWWTMQSWLDGFAYRASLQWWLFPAASIATLAIALLTVSGQAILVARQKPVLALRYE